MVELLPQEPARRRRIPLTVVAVVALLTGALTATAVMLVVNRGQQHRYAVNVFLSSDVTAGQRTAIESALGDLDPVDGIRFESGEQAWLKFKEMFKDRPDLVAGTSPESMPESFRLTTQGREFDCARLAPIRRMSGVDEIQVLQEPAEGKAGAVVACG